MFRRRHPESNRGNALLQSAALPLGHGVKRNVEDLGIEPDRFRRHPVFETGVATNGHLTFQSLRRLQ